MGGEKEEASARRNKSRAGRKEAEDKDEEKWKRRGSGRR